MRTNQRFSKWKAAYTFLAILVLARQAQAATTYTVNVYFADPALYASFISGTTNQYNGTLKSGLFSNTQNFTVTSKKPVITPPPPPSDPILDGTAFDRCFVHGYVFGMEDERRADLKLIEGMFNQVAITDTCGGYTNNQTTLDDAFINGCALGFGIITSTITQRDGLAPPVLVPPFPHP